MVVKVTSSMCRFTCEECVEGMEWVEAYLEDPIFQVVILAFRPQYKT